MDGRQSRAGLSLRIKRPPLLSGNALVGLVVVVVFGGSQLAEVLPRVGRGESLAQILEPLALMGAVCLLVALSLARRFYVRRQPDNAIEFFDGFVALPPHPEATASRQIPYRDILSVAVRGGGSAHRLLLIEARERIFVYPGGAFVDGDAVDRAVAELRCRIEDLDDGHAIMRGMEERGIAGQLFMGRIPWGLQGLVGVALVVYANVHLLETMTGPIGLVAWGALVPQLVYSGELFRLFGAPMLHGQLPHLIFTLLTLYALGAPLERLCGTARLLVVWGLTTLAGTLVATWLEHASLLTGGGYGVWGFLGALASITWRRGAAAPLGFRQPRRWWGVVLALAVFVPLWAPQTEIWGHVASLAVGAASGLLLSAGVREKRIASWGWRCAAALVVGLYGAGLARAVAYAANFNEETKWHVADVLVRAPSTDATVLNFLAWSWAIDFAATPQQLELAETAAERAVGKYPELAPFRDTLATVAYRRGRYLQAVEHERRVLDAAEAKDPMAAVYATQLARFLQAQVREAGVHDVAGIDMTMRREVGPQGGEELVFSLGRGAHESHAQGDLTAYVLASRGGRLVGLVQGIVLAADGGFSRYRVAAIALGDAWDEQTTLQLALVDTVGSAVGQRDKRPRTWQIWNVDQDVLRYP